MDDLSGIHRNIVREILRESFQSQVKPNENFVAFYVKLLLLDPNWGVIENEKLSRTNIQNLVKYVLKDLESYSTQLSTLKMQFSYQCYLETMTEQVENDRKDLLRKLAPLKKDICNAPEPKEQTECQSLNKKIVYYITLLSGLGCPTESSVSTEVLCALKSVLDENELKEFTNLSTNLKECQLMFLSHIVAGIRLFNKDCEKGGAGIPKLPSLLDNAIRSMRKELQKTLICVMRNVNLVTTYIEESHKLIECDGAYTFERIKELSDITDMENIDYLIMYRQYELFIRKLIDEINSLADQSTGIYGKFKELLLQIHKTVEFRLAVAVDIVFPLFEKLANCWIQMQNQIIKLTIFKTLMKNLENFSQMSYERRTSTSLDSISSDLDPRSDAERLESTAGLTLKTDNQNIIVVNPELLPNVDRIKLEYLGFCPWKLVESEGALIPGNPTMGLVIYKDLYYVFSCPEAFAEFCREPNQCIGRVLTLARKKPQLIEFLDIKHDLERIVDRYQIVGKTKREKKMVEHQVQTTDSYSDVVPPKHDLSYKWNIWDMKREAIQLTNLHRCSTVSTQTYKTYFTVSAEVQTQQAVPATTQTKKDNYTNVPKMSRFFYGLRGSKDDRAFIMDLTAPNNV